MKFTILAIMLLTTPAWAADDRPSGGNNGLSGGGPAGDGRNAAGVYADRSRASTRDYHVSAPAGTGGMLGHI